jgi:predicted transcriptional regulator
MAMALKRKKLTISEKVKIIQEVEKNPTVSQNEIAKHFGLPASLISNIILQKASILEEESWCGHILRNKKNMKTSPNEELETLLVQWFRHMRS